MAAPASEDLRELERELVIAAESGESRTFGELREHFGLGHEDLEQALGTLREHGKAVEVAPGEWRGPLFDEVRQASSEGAPAPAPAPVRVSLSTEWEEEAGVVEPITAEAEGGPGTPLALFEGADVRLTRAIADALDADALGKIVKAGLDGLDPEQAFTLEVLP